jgi:hypothetical protein
VTAAGFALMTRLDARASYLPQLLPGVLVFGLGLAATVAPLTAAILGGIDQRHAGIGSAINNAIARVAGLLAIAAIGAIVASRFAAAIDHAAAESHTLDAPARAFLEQARSRPLDTSVPALSHARREAIEPMLDASSVAALHAGLWSMSALLALGGLISAVGIRNPTPTSRT